MSSFLAVYEAASFQRNTICSFNSCYVPVSESVVLVLYVATPSLMKELIYYYYFFLNQTSHACHVWGFPKGCNKEFLWTGLCPDTCSINSPSGERETKGESAVVARAVEWFLVLQEVCVRETVRFGEAIRRPKTVS